MAFLEPKIAVGWIPICKPEITVKVEDILKNSFLNVRVYNSSTENGQPETETSPRLPPPLVHSDAQCPAALRTPRNQDRAQFPVFALRLFPSR